jgi:prepilin-type N-terminal cleavage/methylation domain-containing protein
MKKNNAFTLIETLIAITIVTLVITGVAGLVWSTMDANRRNVHQLQALALAQEGIEAMRFIRDSNWLQNYAWDQGTDLWGADFGDSEALFLVEEDCNPPASACWSFSSNEDDGIVTSEAGTEFMRHIEVLEIQDEDGNTMEDIYEIVVYVEWFDRGNERSVQVSSYLSNWQ